MHNFFHREKKNYYVGKILTTRLEMFEIHCKALRILDLGSVPSQIAPVFLPKGLFLTRRFQNRMTSIS